MEKLVDYKIKEINKNTLEIFKKDSKVPFARVFLSKKLFSLLDSESIKQLENVSLMPGVVLPVVGMSDMHVGYGFPIGGVAAYEKDLGVISPGGVGYDINCSVRLLKTNLTRSDLKGKEEILLNELFKEIPTGVGRSGKVKITRKELDEILVEGATWAIKKGYGKKDDSEKTEEGGRILGADPRDVSQRAKGRGINQLGSIGAGNHFLDVLVVSEVFDKEISKVYGLEKDQVVILIHCGSRGLGHQVASDYIKEMGDVYGYPKGIRELVNAPINSKLGKKYLSAMAASANFAFANKQILTHFTREVFNKYFRNFKADVVYDICHNIAKFEKQNILGKEKEVLILRKGATRSFGPGRKEIVKEYRDVGCPIIIPGSMGTPSFVLSGTKKAEEISYGSTAHGAGRAKSRKKAKEERTFDEAVLDMKKRGVYVKSGSQRGLIEESPYSYKNIEEVVRVSDEAGIGKKVARLDPLIVIIG